MKKHPAVVWMDSSIRFINTGNFSHIKSQMLQTGGVLGMLRVGHSIFAATHPQLYEFFPSVTEKVKQPGELSNVIWNSRHKISLKLGPG